MEKTKVTPDFCAHVDDNYTKLTLEISLPGVAKENISLMMYETSFALTASREDIEYVTVSSICCPVKPGKAKAQYKNGLLKVEVPFKETVGKGVTVPLVR
ncbi:MAG: Hsp20/alpha crystallin family protein [Anaerolineae bacterium]|nr:Hsp20/alpha crystallin family protein [Anaerolineae bacterium]